jgi:2,4-dienoyl-CoA reductase (NADPH2)
MRLGKSRVKDKNTNYKLCEPYQIGQVRLKNRIVKAPFCTVMASREGFVTDSLISCYKTIAKGGVGLSIIEGTVVDPLGISGCPRLAVYDDKYVPGLQRLATAIQQYGSPAILQLQHAGPAYSTGVYTSQKIVPPKTIRPVAASTLTAAEMPMPEKDPPRGLTVEEIKAVEMKFVRAAERAMAAGFVGVELHAAHHYLLSSFLSRAWNRREDEYGGEIKNRVRLIVDIVRGAKKRLGRHFLVGVRLNGIEYGSAQGLTIAETQKISRCIQNAGTDYLSVSGWGFGLFQHLCNLPEQILFPAPPDISADLLAKFKKPGIFVDLAQQIKAAVDLPVITVGRLNPKLGEAILQSGKADLIAFARALIADPELPHKVESGNFEDITPCTACLTCWDTLERGEHLRCRVNPAIGREDEFKIHEAEKKKRVMVVGAGPAGMACARVAALRGHDVTLYDKNWKLGGLLHTASLVKGREVEELIPLVRYYKKQLDQTGVRVKLRTNVDHELIKRQNPDVLILATGSKLKESDRLQTVKRHKMTSADLQGMTAFPLNLLGDRILGYLTRIWLPIGKKVLIIGGLIQGFEIAEFLVKRKRNVTIVESSDQLGTGLPNINKVRLLKWFSQRGVAVYRKTACRHVGGARFELLGKDDASRAIEADTVLAVSIPERNDALMGVEEGTTPERYQVGDCKEPGLIADAIEDGFRISLAI